MSIHVSSRRGFLGILLGAALAAPILFTDSKQAKELLIPSFDAPHDLLVYKNGIRMYPIAGYYYCPYTPLVFS